MKKLVLLLALMGIVAIGYSKDEDNNGNDNKTEYTITQNLGYCLYYTSSDGEIVKPTTHSSPFDATILSNTYRDGVGVIEFNAPITTIGDGAFRGCYRLTSVTIPNSVITIGDGAFGGCRSLQKFNGMYASEDGRCLIIDGVLNSFASAGLTEYNIPNSVTTIGDGAFRGCYRLTSIIIPNSVTTIGNSAFADCDCLTSVTIPNSVTTIGNSAFADCDCLTSVTIPNSVTTIGNYAFAYCDWLTSVTIPNSVITIGDAAFGGCRSLQKFNGMYASEDGRCLIIDGVLNSFASAGLTEYSIPSSVTTIGDGAFRGCDRLTSVSIPNSVTTIGNYAFADCDRLTSVTIPNSVITIGDGAFGGCRSLQKFNSMYASEDGRCLIIDGVLNSFASAGLTEYSIPNSVTTIGNSAFRFCRNLTSVTIPNSVTTIGNSAFRFCRNLTSVTIPNSVTTIGERAFYNCDCLTSVTIPNSVTTIGELAFYDCDCLTSVTIPNSVTTIGERAFYDCDCLTSVTILNSVTTIGEGAFARDTSSQDDL